MNLAHNHKQILKFIIMCLLSVIGLYYYVLLGGTLVKAVVLWFVFSLIGKISTVGYHRWLAHNLIEPGIFGRALILWCMVVTFLSRPLQYVVGHRLHHKFSDTDKDPHHTRLGMWNFLIGNFNLTAVTAASRIPIKDVYRKKDVMFVNDYFVYLYILNLIVFWYIDRDFVLLSFFCLNLRTWILTAVFNYRTHGGIQIQAPINLSFLSGLGYAGEHLHKNHHDDPSAANFGKLTSNFDFTYFMCKHLTKVKN